MIAMRFLLGLLGIVIGIILLKYTPAIYNFFGRDPSAEKYFGRGGTYKFLKFFALAVVIFSLMYMIGFF